MGHKWTTADMPRLGGRRAIVTGANSGIGLQAALALAQHGAEVVLAVRDTARGEAAANRIRSAAPQAHVQVQRLDLASLVSVRAFAKVEAASPSPLHLLINNAGVMAPPKRIVTEDGFELQFATNVLGPFALTAILLPKLLTAAADAARAPRVVTLASIAHLRGRMAFNDLQGERSYHAWALYQQSKLADLIFALELDRRLRAHHPSADGEPKVWSVACHPGVASTNLFVAGGYNRVEAAVRRAMGPVIGALLNSEAEGAVPTLFAATAPEAKSGGYYGPTGFREMRGGDAGPAKISADAKDPEIAARLWSTCEQLTGTSLPFSRQSRHSSRSPAPGLHRDCD